MRTRGYAKERARSDLHVCLPRFWCNDQGHYAFLLLLTSPDGGTCTDGRLKVRGFESLQMQHGCSWNWQRYYAATWTGNCGSIYVRHLASLDILVAPISRWFLRVSLLKYCTFIEASICLDLILYKSLCRSLAGIMIPAWWWCASGYHPCQCPFYDISICRLIRHEATTTTSLVEIQMIYFQKYTVACLFSSLFWWRKHPWGRIQQYK